MLKDYKNAYEFQEKAWDIYDNQGSGTKKDLANIYASRNFKLTRRHFTTRLKDKELKRRLGL